MSYRIARDGQTFGPYNEEEVRRYLASGNILPTDLIQQEGSAEWFAVSVLFPPQVPPVGPYPGGVPRLFPDPPDFPWWAVLLLTVATAGIFAVIWGIVQAGWLKRVNPSSTAVWYYVANAVLFCLRMPEILHTVRYNAFDGTMVEDHHRYLLHGASLILFFLTRFVFRSELLQHFNGAEPLGLNLSGVMTFFFGTLYFQYHFNRINEIKRALRVSISG
ncbi:MAG: DUF4339 domain-containing protein [Acidobacteriaceae bacterium]|nr:DUF4339 domain-containing protein [Acidobacteriaceae bacterium]